MNPTMMPKSNKARFKKKIRFLFEVMDSKNHFHIHLFAAKFKLCGEEKCCMCIRVEQILEHQ